MTLSVSAFQRFRRSSRVTAVALLAALFLGGAASPALAHSTDSGARSYVALGDSFTAGQGAPPYDAGPCLRSAYSSYPRIAALAGRYRLVSNNACSGASLSDIAGQLAGVSSSTRLVTVTIGGIDAGSNAVLAACAPNPASDLCRATVDVSLGTIAALPPRLAATYAAIAAAAPQARVVVLNYPRLFQPGILPLGDLVNSGTDALNAAISAGVAGAADPRVTLVDVTQEFTNHGIGARIPFVVYDPANPTAAPNFHPNALGNALGYVRALRHDGVLTR